MKILLLVFILSLMGCAAPNKECESVTLPTKSGTEITVGGEKVRTVGTLPKVGDRAPDFILTSPDLSDKTLDDFKGKKIILNIFPSLDTKVCQASVRKFNEEASQLNNTVVLGVSADLPFATSRFCEIEGIKNVKPLSTFRSNFGDQYGVKISEGKLKGLMSRAVVIIAPNGKILYTEQVHDISHEPNYKAALEVVSKKQS